MRIAKKGIEPSALAGEPARECHRRELVLAFAIIALIGIVLDSAAESKSGVSAQAISLPTGAGSVSGMGESFEVQLNSGTLTFSIPIQVPPGVANHQPNLALVYSAGIPNGPFGPGWIVPLPAIQRKTDNGQPAFSNQDTFMDVSGEDLILMSDGTYRRELELDGQFARVERLGDGWKHKTKSGATMIFGQYPNATDSNRVSRIVRNDTTFNETLTWVIDEMMDVNGNRIHFFYAQYPDSPGQLYLSEVRYSVFGTNNHSVRFDYELRPDREDPSLNKGGIADYTAGFVRIWGRRCTGIHVYTSGQPVRHYSLGYDLASAEDPAPGRPGSIQTQVSRLRKVTQWDSAFANHLPATTFSYMDFLPAGSTTCTLSNAPLWGISSGAHNGIDLFDINSDGLPDLVDGRLAGAWNYSLNKTGSLFDGLETAMTNSPSHSLSSPSAQVLDINADGRADFANKGGVSPGNYTFYLYEGRGSWGTEEAFTSNPPLDFGDPNAAFLDLDFDKDMDVLFFDTAGERIYLQQDEGWVAVERFWGDPELADLPATLRLSQANVRLADMNGDRLLDIVQWNLTPPFLEVGYWPNLGKGRFAPRRSFGATLYSQPDLNDLVLLDINGDGLADLVKLLSSAQVESRLNLGDGTWSNPFLVQSVSFDHTTTGLRLADINGNGSTDVLFYDPIFQSYSCLDFVGTNQSPQQLRAIDNGMGKRTLIQYASVASYMVEAESAGRPWTLTLPFAMQVVAGYDVQIGQDLDGITGPDRYVTRMRYRDPFYDSEEKEFRGFAFVEKVDSGDEYWGVTNGSPGVLTRIAYHPGAPDGKDNDGDGEVDEKLGRSYEEKALKGMILWTEVTDVGVVGTEHWPYSTNDFLPDSKVYSRTYSDLIIKTVHGTNGALLPLLPADVSREVRFPEAKGIVNEIVEKGAATKRILRTVTDHDPYGNLVRREDWGDVSPGSVLDDERFTITQYRYDTNNWILDRPSRVVVTDEAGNWVRETTFGYDGLGRLTNETRFIDQARPVPVSRVDYDAHGNAFRRINARGYAITNEFDPVFHTYPITESVEIGGGSPTLIARAEYDQRFGNTLKVVDNNGNESAMQYDSFGRLVAIVSPGDSADLPTKSFEYVICDDIRGWRYDYDSSGQLTFTTNSTPGTIVSQIRSYQRERFGQAGVIESVSYVDGMGRVLSSQIEDEGGFSVTSASLFNTRGGLRMKFLPHPSNGGYLANTNGPHSDFEYDAIGRQLKVTLAPDQNGVRHFSRTDYLPLRTAVLDFEDTRVGSPHANTPTTTVRDGLGRTIQLLEVNQQGAATGNYVTTYVYDLQDNLISTTDAQGNVKTNAFDGLGRKIATHDPDKGLFRYFYDDTGNLLQTLDAKGQRNTFTYDGANRILTQDYGDDGVLDVINHYDSASPDYPLFQNLKGALSFVQDLSGASFYSFDARGNVTRKVKRVRRASGLVEDYTFGGRYDAADRAFEATFPDGDRVYYEFNRRGLLYSVPGLVNSIVYNAAGQRTNMVFANGDVSVFNYDPRQRLRQLITTSSTAGTIQNLTYDLDGVANMLAMTDGRGLAPSDPRSMTQSFGLDDIYRLTHAAGTGYGTINYAYDKLGNMTSQTSPDIPDAKINQGVRGFGGLAGASNRSGRNPGDAAGPHALTATGNGYAVNYDDNGNMLSARGNAYSWDTLDRLASVTSTNGVTRFIYDNAGNRVLKFTEGNPASEVVYLSSSFEIREGKAVKFIFAGPVRVARIEGSVPVPAIVTRNEVLAPGWNLIPIAVGVSNSAPPSVLSTISGSYDAVFKSQGNGYLSYVPGQVANTLSNLTAGNAYWIYSRRNCTLTLQGQLYDPPQMSLDAGWQAIAFGSSARYSLPALLGANPHVSAVWKFDNGFKRMQRYNSGLPLALNTAFDLFPGEAALVQASSPGDFILPAATRRIFFYHEDHLGSGNVVTDEAGQIVEELYYYPFGLLRHRHAPNGNSYKSEYSFSDKELDVESGLFNFGARYYDPILCVFASVDPVAMHASESAFGDSQRLNAYCYSGNNPLVMVDPDGQSWLSKGLDSVGDAVDSVGKGVDRAMTRALGKNWEQKAFAIAVSVSIGYGVGVGINAIFASAITSAGSAAFYGAISGGISAYLTTGLASLATSGRWSNASWESIAAGAIGGAIGGWSNYQSAQSQAHRAAVERDFYQKTYSRSVDRPWVQRPTDGIVTDTVRMRASHPVTGTRSFHAGIDIADEAGEVGRAVVPMTDGRVAFSGEVGGYGNLIIVDHGGAQTWYGHLDSRFVGVGDTVGRGSVLGTMGNTGIGTGPHLHFELRIGGDVTNPSFPGPPGSSMRGTPVRHPPFY